MNTARVITPPFFAQLTLSCGSFARSVGHTSKAPESVAHAVPPDRVSTRSSHVRPRLRAVR
ncbi:MAG TPA: hypothetical protein VE974_11115, partial [Thermoanaerobaculia bacterium]|nr:hypothetical protein [Thermoanaerobaculia bacterium]